MKIHILSFVVMLVIFASSVNALVGHDASQIRPGTFAQGNFVFTGDVTLTNAFVSGIITALGGNSTAWNAKVSNSACGNGWYANGTTSAGVICAPLPGGTLWVTTSDNSGIYYTTGRVSVGTSTPTGLLTVNGNVSITGSVNRAPTKIPLFRWLPVGTMVTYASYYSPDRIAFDGVNMWTENSAQGAVAKIAPDGTYTAYIGLPSATSGIAFDGVNMWVSEYSGNKVTKISPTGQMTNYSIQIPGSSNPVPRDIAFDGTNMWTVDYNAPAVSRIRPDGNVTTYGTAFGTAIAFDGTSMWITYGFSGGAEKFSTANGQETVYGTGLIPNAFAFDGVNMWSANNANVSVTKFLPNGSWINYPLTQSPSAIAFDGVNMWTANSDNNSVTRITPSGSITTYYGTGSTPTGIAFDGTYIWTANSGDNTVTKILAVTG